MPKLKNDVDRMICVGVVLNSRPLLKSPSDQLSVVKPLVVHAVLYMGYVVDHPVVAPRLCFMKLLY